MAARKASEKQPTIIADRYRVVKTLGQGGGGAVYLVQDLLEASRLLALKRVEFPKGKETPSIADLKNEFATLSRLHHPHLATVYDFGATEREVYFTSEWIDGRDILSVAREANLNTVFRLTLQILRAMDYLHQRGVLHLDLKPANILVTDPDATGDLRVKLIDFGIARWKKHGRIAPEGFFGTPPYAAPEIIQEKEPSAASDVYALGMILHLIFAGRFPFATQNPFEILMRQPFEDAERIENLNPALPPEFADCLQHMVRRDANERYANVSLLLAELGGVLRENFSLRSPQAPARVLAESDYNFRADLLQTLPKQLQSGSKIVLHGAPGTGKSRLLGQVKAALQLQGLRPWDFRHTASLEEYLPQAASEPQRPIFLDRAEDEPFDWSRLTAVPNACCVIARNAEAPDTWTRVMIPELTEGDLQAFFQEEIQNVPPALVEKLTRAFPDLTPRTFEIVLQAFREEGWLAWTPSGWRWESQEEVDVGAVLTRHRERAIDRERNIREILEGSGLTLPGSALEGMLGLEAGSLAEELTAWARGDWLRCELRQGVPHYRARRSAGGETVAAEFPADSEWLADKLKELYDAGKFGAGIAWLDRLGGSLASERVALHGARHLVVTGRCERAMELLPEKIPTRPEEQGLYHEIRGNALRRLNRRDEAEASAASALAAYEAAVSKPGMARAYILLGNLAKQRLALKPAEEYFRQAATVALHVEDYYGAGFAEMTLALLFQEQGEIASALRCYRRAWQFSKQCRNPSFLLTLSHNWINLLYHMGQASEAEKSCYEWLELALRQGDRLHQAFALNYLALFAGQREHRELQGAHLDQAIALLDPQSSPRFVAQFRVNRAFLKWSQENYVGAQLDAEAALEMAPRLPEDPVLNSIYLALGVIHRDRKRPDWKQAEAYLQQAHAGATRQKKPQVLWEIEYHQGLLEKKRGDLPSAREHFEKALAILEAVIEKTPDSLKASFLRDRKRERILQELKGAGF